MFPGEVEIKNRECGDKTDEEDLWVIAKRLDAMSDRSKIEEEEEDRV
jgi:hypothetical protein